MYDKNFSSKKSQLKVTARKLKPADPNSSATFSSTVSSSSVDLEMGFRVRLGELTAYGKLKM